MNLTTQLFAGAWDRWVAHRTEIKKKLTPTSVRQQFKRFAEWGPDRAILAIEHTIEMGWQGIREPDGNGQPQQSDRDKLKAILEQRVKESEGAA